MESNNTEMIRKIAILGGTGKEGKGLAFRWVTTGYEVIIGSRVIEKAQNAVNELKQIIDPKKRYLLKGSTNDAAAEEADIIVLTVPFEAHKIMLETLKDYIKNKILIDVTVPIVPPKVTKVQMPPAGSAAQEALEILGSEAKVVSAFQNISYERLLNEKDIECDVLVSGTGKETREIVLKLVADAGMVGWDAGPIENSVVAEGLTSILININKQFGSHTAGIKITGVNRS
jgi:8-hydroxy-5-deazaflavin:NADPH oxidoreductase